jgi:hypothetical protein
MIPLLPGQLRYFTGGCVNVLCFSRAKIVCRDDRLTVADNRGAIYRSALHT